MAPETFRRGKIVEYVKRLDARRTSLEMRLDQPEFHDLQQFIKGQIQSIDIIIGELKQEFGVSEEESS